MGTYRQGDIVLVSLGKFPAINLTKTSGEKLEVLGESGNHIHTVSDVSVYKGTDEGIPVTIIHALQERNMIHSSLNPDQDEDLHPDLCFPAGIYEIHQAREFDGLVGD